MPTADINTTFALALVGLGDDDRRGDQGKRASAASSTSSSARPSARNPLLWPLNFLFNIVEYVSKPLSHSLRLFGNMYAGEIIYLLLWMMAGVGRRRAASSASSLGIGWSIFHVLIVVLQAYIFMMLTVVYIQMANESH